jgi:hypothetical protein
MKTYILNKLTNFSIKIKENVRPLFPTLKRLDYYRWVSPLNDESFFSSLVLDTLNALENTEISLSLDYMQDLPTSEDIENYLNESNLTSTPLNAFLITSTDYNLNTEVSNKILKAIKDKTSDQGKIDFLHNFYLNNFASSLLYSNSYNLGTHEDGTEIYSNFNSNFLSSLNFKQLPVSQRFYNPQISNYRRLNLKKNYPSNDTIESFIHGECPNNTKPSIFFEDRNLRHGRYSLDLNTIYPDHFLNEDFNEGKDSYSILHLPSWGSKSLKDPVWKTVSPSFIKKRKGVFVPALSKAKILNEDKTLSEVYFLTLSLVCNDLSKNFSYILSNHQNPSNSFLNFIEKYIFEESLYFADTSKYQNKIMEIYGSYNPLLKLKLSDPKVLDFCRKYSKLTDFPSFSSENTFNSKTNLYISSIPEKDLSLSRKIEKANFKYSKCLDDFKLFKTKLRETSYFLAEVKHFYSLKFDFKFNKTKFNQVKNVFNKLESFNSHYFHLKSLQETSLKDNLKNGKIKKDPFFQNLKNDSISITSISYESNLDDFVLENATLDNFLTMDLSSLKIKEVEFLIDKPVPIYVDSKQNPKAVKVAGPYIVKVSATKLSLKLKDNHSLFAFISAKSYKFHPHVSAVSKISSSANSCLGEASPLIFNAFSKNCLKTIILSAITWVTSANSTDVWGRSYIHFLDYSTIDMDQQLSSDQNFSSDPITQNEVDNFLNTVEENYITTNDELTPAELTPVEPVAAEPVAATITYTPYSQHINVL